MKKSSKPGHAKIVGVATAFALALVLCGVGPALAADHGHDNHGGQHHGDNDRGGNRGDYRSERPDNYYVPAPNYYSAPEPDYYYAQQPNYYPEQQPQGVNLFFGF